jgi:RNA polymerase sigma factor for flagellar operon FliA
VIDHLRSLDWLSRGARQRARLVQNAISALWEKNQRSPSDDELASYLNIDLPKLRQSLLDSSRVIVSLDATVNGQTDEEVCLHELLPDDSQAEPSEMVEEDEMKTRLVEILHSLPEREQLILSLYYYEELTFKEIGAVLEVSESRVCQLHSRAVMMLRTFLSQNTLPAAVKNMRRARPAKPAPFHPAGLQAFNGNPRPAVSYGLPKG